VKSITRPKEGSLNLTAKNIDVCIARVDATY
jgi:hypothetical protein